MSVIDTMTGFTEDGLVRKLQKLNSNQQSIQKLSLWLIDHRKHYVVVVKIWLQELIKVKDKRLLAFMYLANDIIENSRKMGPEYGNEFGEVLVEALKHMVQTGNTKTKDSLHKILSTWEEQKVYDDQKLQQFKEAINSIDAVSFKALKRKQTADSEPEDMEKKVKCASCSSLFTKKEPKQEAQCSKTEVVEQMETDIAQRLNTSNESDQLIKRLLELNSNSSKEEISSTLSDIAFLLPPEESGLQLMSKLGSDIYFRRIFIPIVLPLIINLKNLHQELYKK